MADPRSRASRRRLATISGAVAVLLVIGVIGFLAARTPATALASYRTVTPSRGAVDQVISTNGTLTPVSQVVAAFPTSGRVTSVLVTAGQKVTQGQRLATMDTTPLKAAVLAAEATVAQDEVAIETDQTSIANGTTGATTTPVATSPTATRTTSSTSTTSPATSPTGQKPAPSTRTGARTGSGGTSATALLASVATAQRLVNQTCSMVLSGLAGGGPGAAPSTGHSTPSGSRTPSTSASSPSRSPSAPGSPSVTPSPSASGSPSMSPSPSVSGSPSVTPSPSASGSPSVTPSPSVSGSPSVTPSPSASGTPSTTPTVGGSGTPSAAELSACLTSLTKLAGAERAAAQALQASVSQTGTTSGGTASPSAGGTTGRTGSTGGTTGTSRSAGTGSVAGTGALGTTTSGSAGTRSGGGSGGGAMTPAAQLLQDQGQLAADQQTLTQAQQHLAAATLTAPIGGLVAQVSLTTGTTASTSQGITIIGAGAATITGTVTLAEMPKVALGDTVRVNPVGSSATLTGTVTTIGVLPASTSGSTPTYPVTVTIASGTEGLPSGDVALMSIVTTSVADALTLPESAVIGTGSGRGTVTLLSGGTTSTVAVSTGAVGSGRVQILSGLATGATVAIANLSEPLPTNTGIAGRAGAAVGQIAGRVRGG